MYIAKLDNTAKKRANESTRARELVNHLLGKGEKDDIA